MARYQNDGKVYTLQNNNQLIEENRKQISYYSRIVTLSLPDSSNIWDIFILKKQNKTYSMHI